MQWIVIHVELVFIQSACTHMIQSEPSELLEMEPGTFRALKTKLSITWCAASYLLCFKGSVFTEKRLKCGAVHTCGVCVSKACLVGFCHQMFTGQQHQSSFLFWYNMLFRFNSGHFRAHSKHCTAALSAEKCNMYSVPLIGGYSLQNTCLMVVIIKYWKQTSTCQCLHSYADSS